jgi:hypothetical protein
LVSSDERKSPVPVLGRILCRYNKSIRNAAEPAVPDCF